MAEDLIRYDILAQDALRGVVRKVLAEVAKTGLPGDHHFYITFETRAPGVRVSTRLMTDYPEEMTIIIQHQYWDLSVTEHAFEIGLSFKGVPERLLVPFTALKSFVDPSVQFGLQFETAASDEDALEGSHEMEDVDTSPLVLDTPDRSDEPPAEPSDKPAAEVVRLDAFRKKS
ncbi:SspB family protein [Kaistia defluvii]|uniref:SspB family protein n=1 Tax=Kaistia defluvii TaxID=410841 RepID=UPI00224C9BA3|nr:SspB family protein [Kaistia defluvii]MCX5516941.1 SspB family protein [Kaistia defluvii]